MAIGNYRHRITVQKKTKVPDGMGGWTETWEDFFDTWAAINPVSSQQRIEYQKLGTNISHEIHTRAAGVTAQHRIKFCDRYFYPQAPVSPGELGRDYKILAEEKVPDPRQ